MPRVKHLNFDKICDVFEQDLKKFCEAHCLGVRPRGGEMGFTRGLIFLPKRKLFVTKTDLASSKIAYATHTYLKWRHLST